MSGGYFDHDQFRIVQIADAVESLIVTNDDKTPDEWGNPKGRGYTPQTIARFREALICLRRAAVYAQRIDWLVSCDDGEDSFHRRLAKELANFEGLS